LLMAGGELIDHHVTDIVPGRGITVSGIAQPHHQYGTGGGVKGSTSLGNHVAYSSSSVGSSSTVGASSSASSSVSSPRSCSTTNSTVSITYSSSSSIFAPSGNPTSGA